MNSVMSTRTTKIIFIIFVAMLFSIVFAQNIPALHVDSASHYSLVDKIERDFFINQGYIENLGEMAGYPPGAHYAAAFFNIFTDSGLVSMNIVNILALALGWTVIATLLLETSVFALFLMAGIVACFSASGLAVPLFGMEVTGENFLYSQFVSTGFFIGVIYLIYKVNLPMPKRIILSLAAFYLGMHIHALFALAFFAGSFFYYIFLEYIDGSNNKLLRKNCLLIGLYSVLGSGLFFSSYYTQFANIIRKHNGSIYFTGFSNNAEDITLLSYVFIFICIFMSIAGLALYRFHHTFRSKFKANFVLINSFLLGISVLAAAQLLLLYFGEVTPYVVKKYLFGTFTLFLTLVVIYISVYVQLTFQKLNSNPANQSKALTVILTPALFVLMVSFNWSESSVDLVSITNAQVVAKQYFNASKGDPSYRNTIAQFQNLTMPENWLITIGELQVYKWSQLSHVVVHQIPNELPDSAFVLTDARAGNLKDNGRLYGQYRVYSAEELYGPVLLESGRKYLLSSANPDATRFFGKGFSALENWGTWTSEEEAELRFMVEKPISKNVLVSLTTSAWLAKGRENFVVIASVDGVKVSEREFSVPESVEWEFEVPGKYVGANGVFAVRLNFTNPATPLSVGQSEDPRVLGLGIQSLTVTYE